MYNDLNDGIATTTPWIEFAVMDKPDEIKAHLSHPLLTDKTTFSLYINKKEYKELNLLVTESGKDIILTGIPTELRPFDLLELYASNTYTPAKVVMREYLNQFYSAEAMGIVFDKEEITLRLWAPTAVKVELAIYSSATQEQTVPNELYLMNPDLDSGTHHALINRAANENKFYLYRLSFNELKHNGESYIRISYAVDPYALAVSVGGDMGVLLDINAPSVTPPDWEHDYLPAIPKEDAIIYEMHIRDFTIRPDSNVSPEIRGRYLGAVAGGCCYTNDSITVATGIDSLVELGITHVHLLPIFDFSSVDETKPLEPGNRNWGYDPKNYNVPEGSYATNPYDPGLRIYEVRSMIQAFHKRGIRVIMDMVYNHMTNTDNFDNIVPFYYFRTDSSGKLTNGSGCGNELASERPMVRKFIADSILHWQKQYKIDGIRLDLMELIDLETMKMIVRATHESGSDFLIYGEPWKGGDSPLLNGASRGTQKDEEFSIFNDIFRDAIRGNNNPGQGFINGQQHNPAIKYSLVEGLKGSINGLTSRLKESINYVDAHDNYTLWDHIEKSQHPRLRAGDYRQNLPENLFESSLVRQNMLALGIILTSQGISFLHGGVEILRTKQGDHNSYKSNDEVNAFYWEDKARFKPVFDYVRGLIELRKSHPAFRMFDRQQIDRHLEIKFAHNNPGSGVIMLKLSDYAHGDSWKNIAVLYNGTNIDDYSISSLIQGHDTWNMVVNHEKAGTAVIERFENGHLPNLRSHSLLVMYNE